MLKTFTLNNIKEEVLSESEGKMTFELTDENGDVRTVWGTTTLNEEGLPVSITAIKTREHPLIQCLFKSQPNETIKIEFTQYNEIFERKDDDKTPTIEELIEEMKKKPLRMGELLEFTE